MRSELIPKNFFIGTSIGNYQTKLQKGTTKQRSSVTEPQGAAERAARRLISRQRFEFAREESLKIKL